MKYLRGKIQKVGGKHEVPEEEKFPSEDEKFP